MRAKSTLVGIFFLLSGVILAIILSKAAAGVFAVLRVTDTALVGDTVTLSRLLGIVVALLAAGGFFAWPKTKNYIGAVSEELNKVNWPSWSETKVNTLVVVVTSVIAALVLGVFDMTFGLMSTWLANNV